MTGAKEKAQEDCPVRKAVHSHSGGEVRGRIKKSRDIGTIRYTVDGTTDPD